MIYRKSTEALLSSGGRKILDTFMSIVQEDGAASETDAKDAIEYGVIYEYALQAWDRDEDAAGFADSNAGGISHSEISKDPLLSQGALMGRIAMRMSMDDPDVIKRCF